MDFQDFLEGLDCDVLAQARRTIQRLSRRGVIRRQDVADFEQSLMLHVLKVLPAFDAARGTPSQFLAVVVKRGLINQVRNLKSRRQVRPSKSLEKIVEADPLNRLSDTIDETSIRRHRGVRRRSHLDLANLCEDVAGAVVKLPKKLRAAAEALMHERTLTAAARKLGIPRTTLNSRRDALRSWFLRAGLSDYL